MESKYTATVYTNDHIIKSHNGNDLCDLTTSMLVELDRSTSGSYGTITDNAEGVEVQRYRKTVIDD